MNKIKLGYEVDSGKQIDTPIAHMIVTGITQQSGKTTTLESLSSRSKKKFVVFRTKRGETSFTNGNFHQPYFKDRSDWEFIKSIIEAIIRTKIRYFEQTEIIKICEQSSDSIFRFAEIVDEKIASMKKQSGFKYDILINLQAYLKKALPKLQNIPFVNELNLKEGLNIINLEDFHDDDAVLSLIISSVTEEVQRQQNDTITIVPESWRFIPQDKNNPCKAPIEKLIRQGATNGNFVWLDSQDLAGVEKSILKQVTVYMLGYQAEPNEVKHTLATIPLAKDKKPKDDEIMNLGKGEFYYASRDLKAKIFVQGWWVSDQQALDVALKKITIDDLPPRPKTTAPEKKEYYQKSAIPEQPKPLNNLSDETLAYVDKIVGKIQRQIDELKESLHKKPTQIVNTQEIVKEVLSRIPSSGNVVYKIAPPEKIKKDFIQTAKNKIIDDVSKLSNEAKKMLQYIESRNVEVTVTELCMKCFLMKQSGGGYGQTVNNYGKELINVLLVDKNRSGRYKGLLKNRITDLLQVHEASDEEINSLYDHIIMELLGEKVEAI